MLRHIIISIAYILIAIGSKGGPIDNLEKQLALNQSDTALVRILNELSWQYFSSNLSKSRHYAMRALLVLNIKDHPLQASNTYNRLGNYYFLSGNYDSAIFFQKQSYNIRSNLPDTGLLASAAYSVAIACTRSYKTKDAIKFLVESENLSIAINDYLSQFKAMMPLIDIYLTNSDYLKAQQKIQVAKRLIDEGIVNNEELIAGFNVVMTRWYLEKSDYRKAQSSFMKANKYYAERGNFDDKSRLLSLKADILFKQNELDSAINKYQEALKFLEITKNQSLRLKINSNLGQSYSALHLKDSAKKCFDRALLLVDENILDSSWILIFYKHYGDFKVSLDDYEGARFFYKKCLTSSRVLPPLVNLEVKYNLHLLYTKLGQYKEANNALWDYQNLRDSFHNLLTIAVNYESNLEEMKRLQVIQSIDSEKVISQEKLKRTRISFFLMSSVAVILILLSLIAYQIEKRRRYEAQKNQEISRKNQALLEEKVDGLLKKQELKSIVHVLEIQERERRRIAQDLHDRLGGMLATTKLLFHDVQKSIGDLQIQSRNSYNKALDILDSAGEEVRKVAHNLVSGALKNFGLEAALRELAGTVQQSESINFQFISHGLNDRLNTTYESHLYRIVQEMVSNTLKHAQATQITLQLLRDNDRLNLVYEDNGAGFDLNKAKAGMGLKSIASRVEELKGHFEIDSGKGGGTTYNITIPLKLNI